MSRTPAIVVCLLVLLLPVHTAAMELVLSTGEDESNHRYAYLYAVITECFHRMGIDIRIQNLPHKRALETANLGQVDGTFIRSKLISRSCPELVMVPEPLIDSRVSIFTTDPSILDKLTGWESLAPYRVAYISGWHWVDCYLPPCKEIHQIKKKNSLLLFLEEGRADVAIYEEGLGYEEMERLGLTDIYVLKPPLSVTHMYLYMYREHSDLVPDIAETLQLMSKDGTLQELRCVHIPHDCPTPP